MRDLPTIAPCPFCGDGDSQLNQHSEETGLATINCDNCGARGPFGNDPKAAWNRRATDKALAPGERDEPAMGFGWGATPEMFDKVQKDAARTLFAALKHGDEEHQAWLLEALGCWFASKPIPPPRSRPQPPSAPRAERMTLMVDAAMVEMQNISPPMRRSECERLIKAALAASPEPSPPSGWRPIETMPEQVVVLLYVPYNGRHIHVGSKFTRDDGISWTIGFTTGAMLPTPLAWMPLPPAPSSEQPKEAT